MPRIYYIQYIVMTKIRHLHVIERRSLSIRNIISFYISVSKRACCLQLQNSTDFRSFGKDISKIAQKHLKEDDFFVTSLRCFKYISKKVSFVWRLEGISSISQNDVYSVMSLRCIKNICCNYLWFFKNTPQKWFLEISSKIDARSLETLKKWNQVCHECKWDDICVRVLAGRRQSLAEGVLFTSFSDFF